MFASHTAQAQQATADLVLWKREEGTLPMTQPLNTRQASTEIWNTELRAIQTVMAGAVGANGGEANVTHCAPPVVSIAQFPASLDNWRVEIQANLYPNPKWIAWHVVSPIS